MRNRQAVTDENLPAVRNQAGECEKPALIQLADEAPPIRLKRRDGRRRKGRRFEREWIASLRKNSDDANRAEEWLEAQAWSDQ